MIVARLCRMSQDEDLLQALMVTSLPARAATFLANAVHAHWPRRNILDPKLPYALWLALAAQNELPLQYSVYSGLSLADTTELKILHERHIWRNPDMAPFSFITVLDLQDPLLPISDQFINEIRPLLGRSLTALRVSHNSITNACLSLRHLQASLMCRTEIRHVLDKLRARFSTLAHPLARRLSTRHPRLCKADASPTFSRCP